MIALSLLGGVLFYCFVYTLFSQYAEGKVLMSLPLNLPQPLYLRLSPDAALLALKWLIAAAFVYLALDFLVAIVRHSSRPHAYHSR